MWELIRENKRKSWYIFAGMGGCLLLLGYLIGTVFFPPDGGLIGLGGAVGIWLILSVISYASGDTILLQLSHARPVSHSIHPQLFNIVEEMKIAASLPVMPKVYIIDDPVPNAFATGRSLERATIVVTAGLLTQLNRDELQGVIAHEMAHILNRDILYLTFAGIMLGTIVIVSDVFLRSMWFSRGGGSRRYRVSRGGGQLQLVLIILAVVFALLAPLLARLFYFALSRKREYLADAQAVRLTRYPEGLAAALERISGKQRGFASVNKITAPMYIINPLQNSHALSEGLLSTHPPVHNRIDILRSLQHGVQYTAYSHAYRTITRKKGEVLPVSALEDSSPVGIREATVQPQSVTSRKQQARELGDLLRVVNDYAFLVCVCGLKVKVPPQYTRSHIACPRCNHSLEVPVANLAAAAVAAAYGSRDAGVGVAQSRERAVANEPLVYVRKSNGWESFSCSCGHRMQLSPLFMAKYMKCDTCGRKIEIQK